jgi:NADP-reducing hydrogenase subunit HndC
MPFKNYILVCGGGCCESTKADEVYTHLIRECELQNVESDVQVVRTVCFGIRAEGPVVQVLPAGSFYVNVQPEDAKELVEAHIVKGRPLERLLYENTEFYRKQFRVVLRNCGIIDPDSIDEYIARDGYAALEKVIFDMKPEDVIDELKKSQLKGRGGAGFPTWMKWNFTKSTPSDVKYVVCNADEGDPGAYMDRSTLEGDPFSIIEAMTIAGKTIGAAEGYIYIRAEYPIAINKLKNAITLAKEYGLLGENILGSDFSFDIELRLGAGAFVCGEETALLASIEGNRGMPVPRPPFPSVKGLWGKPTVINNVETWANIPVILTRGGDWFANIGTEKSKGTKVFALTGKINNSGLVEVPMGTPLRDIVYDIGGGIADGKEFKAVQTGGPSGGVITKDYLDTPIDYENLQELGSIMGSGGMIVMDESDCMVDVTKFYLGFCVDESCGKCAPCRVGGRTLYNILDRITKGEGEMEDLDKMKRICLAMQKASLCGLGQTAPNPILSALKYFEEEFLAHIQDRRCPAGSCKELITYYILPDKCIGCGVCARKCPVAAISGDRRKPHVIDYDLCIKCGECFDACKFSAVLVR